MPQNGILFNDTIEANLRYGNPEATQADLERIARQCSIHDSIMSMPDGYQTQVGDLGSKLSGGERQRLILARAMMRTPQLLILDEATSALDTQSEHEVQRALEELMRDRTTVIIAHRLSTVIDADEIIVLERGQVAERGTHEELLSENGIYAAMWNRQRQVEQAREILDRHVIGRGLHRGT